MKDLRDGDKPNAEVSLAGDKLSGRADEAATGGVKHSGGNAASSGSATGGAPPQAALASDSPDHAKRTTPSGRRRRRRRKSPGSAAPQLANGEPQTGGAPAPPPAANGAPAKSGEKRGRRRRGKKGRAIQGRPLAPQKEPGQTSPQAHPASPVEETAPPRHPHPQSRTHDRVNGGPSAPGTQPQRRRAPDNLYAALDLGTNNCRLLIAQPTRPGQFRVVDAFSRIVRLGEGLDATGELAADAMDRAVEALKVCAGKLENRPARRHRLIATEACRSARNGAEFLDRVFRETGLQLEIVTRETEARLAVAGCSSLVGRDTDGLVLFDIGGGSSEIAMIDLTENRSNRLANHIKAWTSLPVGVVTLSERHGGCMVTREIFDGMVEEVDAMLAAFTPPPLPAFARTGEAGHDRMHLLGTSGTVTTLAGLHLELPRYDRRKVDGLWMSNSQVDSMLDMLLSWDFDARAANPCIGADRADLVLAGCAILQSIRKRWPSQRMRVADRGLREGLLNEMMAADGAWRGRGRQYRYRNHRPNPEVKQ